MKKEKIKDFFRKVKNFSLLRALLDRKISSFMTDIKSKEELRVYYQGKLNEADELKVNSLREISKISDEIKELKKKMDDTLKVRCP